MIRSLLIFTFLFLSVSGSYAQDNTVGLLYYDPSSTYEGYNLIYPHNQPTAYLLDMCGQVVNQWTDDTDFRPGNTAYLTPEGKLVKTKRASTVTEDAIWAGGGGAYVEIWDWDNNLEWSYFANDETERLHHDIAVKENGNILMVVWEYKSLEEVIQAGRDTSTLADGTMWPDKVIEVDPKTDEVVWEWHTWDHLIQDFDATKDNFGVVADHPERINVNYDDNSGSPDWMHTNAIDYHEETKQIMISVPTFHELWIIDNTTTTEQAASTFGGFGNRGGDLMYRFGNPAAHNNGTADDQKLFYQHDARWVDDFLSPAHPHFGKISVFNNRVGADFSTANIIDPGWDMYKWTYLTPNGQWGPTEFDLTITHPTPTEMWSTGLSSFQTLNNGNYLICVGRFGYSFEIDPEGEIVWEYKTPRNGQAAATQGDVLEINNNLTFRMARYPLNYKAFEDRSLEPQGYIELEPNLEYCGLVLSTDRTPMFYDLKVFPNPAEDFLTIEYNTGKEVDIRIFDLLGRDVHTMTAMGGRQYVDISNWDSGIYFIEIDRMETRKLVVRK